MSGDPYTALLLIWVAKHAMKHFMSQSIKKTIIGVAVIAYQSTDYYYFVFSSEKSYFCIYFCHQRLTVFSLVL